MTPECPNFVPRPHEQFDNIGGCRLFNVIVHEGEGESWCYQCRKLWFRGVPISEPSQATAELIHRRVSDAIRDRMAPSAPPGALHVGWPQIAFYDQPEVVGEPAAPRSADSPTPCGNGSTHTIPELCVHFDGHLPRSSSGCPQKRPLRCDIFGERTWDQCQGCPNYAKQND